MKTLPVRLFAFFLLMGFGAFAQSDTYSSRSVNSDGHKMVWKNSNGVSSFNVEMRGKIELTDDDSDIKSMSSDGYLEITKTVFGSRRSLIISPQAGGLKREYYEGRTSLPYEPEGRKWMSEIMPELVRTTTIGAESRVNRYFKQGGTTSVLNLITSMESDYVKHHYANLLMAQPSVGTKDYATIINKVAGTMDSDYYLAEFLQKNLTKFLPSKEATDAVFAATTKMESDHYKTEVIKEALRSQAASPEAIKSILAASSQMESDHYKTEVLTTLMKQSNLTDAIVSEMINASKSIESDHYKTQVLTKALAKQGLSATSYQRVLESVGDIESDHYKTEVLTDLLKNKLPTDQIFNLVDLSTHIESDHYLTIVYTQVMKNQDMNDDAFKKLIDRATNLDSDHYASQILRSALALPGINDNKLISIINAAATIDSDHYITEVLTAAAPKVKTSGAAVKDAYRLAAKHIDSETYYGRALKAVE
jgi:SOS response regulatory protein OraA/RecX/dUTPase